jgi:hypothetical protein
VRREADGTHTAVISYDAPDANSGEGLGELRDKAGNDLRGRLYRLLHRAYLDFVGLSRKD